MTVGIVMLVHNAFNRAEDVIRHWAKGGCPVVVHVDQNVEDGKNNAFVAKLADLHQVKFCKRHVCEWGTWGIVAGTQSAVTMLLSNFPDVRHVYLTSGSCMPLRPVSELVKYLDSRPHTDFIESATTADVPWTVGGLDVERFTLRFPFSWKSKRCQFDTYVKLQRAVNFKRKIPVGLVPHLGSQWWCLTRKTLFAVLQDPERGVYDRYFKKVWIPDESYFQTLVRLYSENIESRSLTLSKFDFQGKPHIFYDDHLQLLRRSDCFVARKIWPNAIRLYKTFLADDTIAIKGAEPNPAKIDRIFNKAMDRRTQGRPGLYMQSRYPNRDWENGVTAAPYSVFEGFTELFENFEPWLAKATRARVHGHLYAPDRVEFEGRQESFSGSLTDNPTLRDHNSQMFLANLIWSTRGERQCLQFGPQDSQDISWMLATDPNAHVSVITGAWAIRLFQSNRSFSDIRKEASHLQQVESEHLRALRSPWANGQIKIWTVADFMHSSMKPLQMIVDDMTGKTVHRFTEVPPIVDLTGFGEFLQKLKNQGMHPYLVGDFPVEDGLINAVPKLRKTHLAR